MTHVGEITIKVRFLSSNSNNYISNCSQHVLFGFFFGCDLHFSYINLILRDGFLVGHLNFF